MKKKLPSYTLKKVLEIANSGRWPCYTLEVVRKMFPGKERITARDVLKVPSKKFEREQGFSSPGQNKCFVAGELLPVEILTKWWYWASYVGCAGGSSAYIKRGLKLCDQYEKGEIK